MAKHLTGSLKELIVKAIKGWKDPHRPDAKITWSIVEDLAKVITGVYRTRQALNRHPEIKKAYEDRIGGVIATKSKKDLRIERLEKENAALQQENQKLIERFLRWSYNSRMATMAPLSEDDLNKPLPNPEKAR